MKKLVICFFALCMGYSTFAQTDSKKPEEKVTVTTEKVFEEVNPEKEAKKFTDMMAETSEISEEQRNKIYKVVLQAMKDKKALGDLREKNEDKFKEKENEIFRTMNDEVNAIMVKG